MIDRETTSKILEAANIVDVVGEFVTLRKSGMNYKGLCPFHNESTPSFSVSPSRNYCHCFSCGKGGSPVGFIMEHEQMTYPEALRWLANKYHIEIKEKELSNEERQQQSERESMFIVNEFAANYYHDILKKNTDGIAIGMQYFRTRGFRDDIIEKFRLGFSLTDRYAFPREARTKGYKDEFLVKTGLCYGDDKLVDRFSGRAIFPWINMAGKVVAFGGRVLDSRTKGVNQKYVNSPESDIYHKERELYGIFQAKRQIAKDDRVFMVEGYTDVISMHQSGIENVVANSGTALSMHQVRMLHRFTNNIVLLYDGDAAGIHAALRGTDMLLSEGMNIKVLILPDGDDPDSFARKHTAEDFRQYVEEHQTDFIQFKMDVLLNGVTDPIKRSEAISSITKSISVIPDPIIRATYLQDCSSRLQMRQQTLINSMNGFIREDREQKLKRRERNEVESVSNGSDSYNDDRSPNDAVSPDNSYAVGSSSKSRDTRSALHDVERLLIKEIVRHGEEFDFEDLEQEDGSKVTLSVAEYIDANLAIDELSFSDPLYQRILEEAVTKSRVDGWVAAPYFSQHPDIAISQATISLIIDRYSLSKSLTVEDTKDSVRQRVEHLLMEFRIQYVEIKLKELIAQLPKFKDDAEKTNQLMTEYIQMQRIRSALAKKLGRNIK